MSGHTPTPWRVSSSDPKAIRRNARFIAASERETDTQFIVRAANCHDDLVAALREIAGQPLDAELGDDGPWGSSYDFAEGYDQCIRKARAALAKAAQS